MKISDDCSLSIRTAFEDEPDYGGAVIRNCSSSQKMILLQPNETLKRNRSIVSNLSLLDIFKARIDAEKSVFMRAFVYLGITVDDLK